MAASRLILGENLKVEITIESLRNRRNKAEMRAEKVARMELKFVRQFFVDE